MPKSLSVFTLFPFPLNKTLLQSLDYKNQSMECSSIPYSTIFDSDEWNVLYKSA